MKNNSQIFVAGLYVVATPIGNLSDISFRALEILKKSDLIACEDTRVSGKLLSHFGIKAKTTSYHDHNADEKRPYIIEQLLAGKTVSLISDAGTPLISDPGYKLVREVSDLGIKVFPIPGASSLTTALSVCGLPTDRVLFAGFLPNKAGARDKAIEEVADIKASLVFFESVHRLQATLIALAEILGEREAVVARELTKLHEELRRGKLSELAGHYKESGNPKGEIVIVIAPPNKTIENTIDSKELLTSLLKSMSLKDAVAETAKITKLPRQDIYKQAIEIRDKS